MNEIAKVYAYITHNSRLLVFRHVDLPEAGIQLPGGTVEKNEPLAQAAVREVVEETGLTGLPEPIYLGDQMINLVPYGTDQIHHRHFFHFPFPLSTSLPQSWRHWEIHPSEGEAAEIEFEFFWMDLKAVNPGLIAQLDALIHLI